MFGKEPGVVLGALSELVRQVIPFLIVFGFISWTGEKTAAFNILVGVVVGFLNVMLTRSQTVTVETANRQIEVGIASPSGTSVEKVIAAEARESK